MDDLISRKVAIDEFYKYPNVTWTTLDILKYILDLPPAHFEIVRCKDCKHYLGHSGEGIDGYMCDLLHSRKADAGFFCADGERAKHHVPHSVFF